MLLWKEEMKTGTGLVPMSGVNLYANSSHFVKEVNVNFGFKKYESSAFLRERESFSKT